MLLKFSCGYFVIPSLCSLYYKPQVYVDICGNIDIKALVGNGKLIFIRLLWITKKLMVWNVMNSWSEEM